MSDAALADLSRSGITQAVAEEAGLCPVDSAKRINLGFAAVPALVIPYLHPITRQPVTYGPHNAPFVRVRYLADVLNSDGKVVRYTQPRASGVHAYYPPVIDWAAVFANPSQYVVATEGEKKALSLAMLGVPCIGLGGVYNFKDTTTDALLPDLVALAQSGRVIVICYDSDAEDNPNVRHAELALVAELQRRGGSPCVARLTPGPDGKKRGIDDYVAAGQVDALMAALNAAEHVTTLEMDVMRLNEQCAFLEGEDAVYVVAEDRKLTKSAFVNGSQFSALETAVPKTVKGKPVAGKAALAPIWLSHPATRRYSGTVFDPASTEREIVTPAGIMLNRWRGLTAKEGPIQPFLDLLDFLMSRSDPVVRDLILCLLAYKAQNPAIKVPLATVLIGPQGCGKSLYARVVGAAFAPYNYSIPSIALKASFQPFLESSLMVVIDEAQSIHVDGAKEKLRTLISDKRQELNKKHVSQCQIDTYCQFILTSNDRRVGAYDSDDRRMIVVDCPPKREPEWYDMLVQWEKDDGPAHLMHYLLTYDLQGWEPPKHAPMTSEKYMAYVESLTPVQRLAEEMTTADSNAVALWLDAATAWARVAQTSHDPVIARRAAETLAYHGSIDIRPWYTPEELALMFPAIVGELHGARKQEGTIAGRISSDLRNCGVPYLRCSDDPQGFRWHGRLRQYLIVADRDRWQAPISQAQFEQYMGQWRTYAEARGLRARA